MASASLSGLEAKLAAMRALPKKIQEAVQAQLDEEAKELAEAIKRAVPVKTGALRDSVRVEPTGDPLKRRVAAGGPSTTKKIRSRKVGAGRGKTKGVSDADFARGLAAGNNTGEYDYARGVEFGHLTPKGARIGPRPFFFQTWRARRKATVQRIKAASRKAIRSLFPK